MKASAINHYHYAYSATLLKIQETNSHFVALHLCQNPEAPLENQEVAGRHSSFTVEDGPQTARLKIVSYRAEFSK
jgi:hypothetical protein